MDDWINGWSLIILFGKLVTRQGNINWVELTNVQCIHESKVHNLARRHFLFVSILVSLEVWNKAGYLCGFNGIDSNAICAPFVVSTSLCSSTIKLSENIRAVDENFYNKTTWGRRSEYDRRWDDFSKTISLVRVSRGPSASDLWIKNNLSVVLRLHPLTKRVIVRQCDWEITHFQVQARKL